MGYDSDASDDKASAQRREMFTADIPQAARRAGELFQRVSQPTALSKRIMNRSKQVVFTGLGAYLIQRARDFGLPGKWAGTVGQRFSIGKLRPEKVQMTLSPYLPPQQQLRSTRR